METRTPQEGAEAARKVGIEIASMVYEKQLAYGDASGIQHEIWKALLKQYLTPLSPVNGATPGYSYLIPVELMDHIPRLTRVLDRMCRIVSNPAQDRMGEDPWRDLAGDAICGVVMPRTKPTPAVDEPIRGRSADFMIWDDIDKGGDRPTVFLTMSLPDCDYEFEGYVRECGSDRYIDAKELFNHKPSDGVIYGRRGSDKNNSLPIQPTDLGEFTVGNDDPFEDLGPGNPIPAETRIWSEPPLPYPDSPHLKGTTHGNEEAQAEEFRKRREETARANAELQEHTEKMRARALPEVPPMRIAEPGVEKLEEVEKEYVYENDIAEDEDRGMPF